MDVQDTLSKYKKVNIQMQIVKCIQIIMPTKDYNWYIKFNIINIISGINRFVKNITISNIWSSNSDYRHKFMCINIPTRLTCNE